MTRLRVFFHRLLGLFLKRKLERELEEEIRSHLEMQIEDNLRQGMSPEDARRAARLSFGGVEQVKEAYRDKSRLGWIESLWLDLRYGVRMLLKKPGFTLMAVLTLSLGIGANTAIFSVVNMFIFRPLPVERPDELAAVFVRDEGEVGTRRSYFHYIRLRDQNSVFSGLAAHKMEVVAISAEEHPGETNDQYVDVIRGEIVSGNYFDVLGVRPALGRTFAPEEDRAPNSHPVVVLSYGSWQRRFRSDPGLVGRAVYLNGRPFTVIGITPPSFKGTEHAIEMDFWAPIMMQAQLGGGAEWMKEEGLADLSLLGRLKPGVTRRQAEAHLYTLAQGLAGPNPGSNEGIKFNVVSEIESRYHSYFGWIKLIAALALGLSGLVTLIACANVANLLLARATARSREIVIRLAMGAGRWRIIRQLLTESMLLALLGGGLGLLLALWGAELMSAGSPFIIDSEPAVVDFSPDLRVLGWTVIVSLLTGLLFGLAPAWHAARTDLIPALKNEPGAGATGSRRLSSRNLLVIAQLAISVVVLVSAGLFVKALYKAQTADAGFQTENLLSLRLDPGLVGYDAARARMFFTDLVRQVETLPGVRIASLSHTTPFGGEISVVVGIVREGDPPPPPDKGLNPGSFDTQSMFYDNPVGAKYFETMGIPLALGRGFTERDHGKAPAVVIINQAAARRLYGTEQQALGKRLRDGESAWMEIVGIAQDGNLEEPRPSLLTPFLQSKDHKRMTLLVRATSASEFKSIAENVRREVRKLDARVPVFQLKLGEDHISPALRGPRFVAGVSLTLAVIALTLAGMGLYGVMAYAVSLRTKEIGIRMALGARPADVLGLVLRQGIFLTLLGVALGLGASLALTRLVMNMLYGVSTTDPLTFVVIALLLTFVASLACWIPARRATKVDPMITLKYE
jgi:putative ABC transport system permease protein